MKRKPTIGFLLTFLLTGLAVALTGCRDRDDTLTPVKDFSTLTNFDKLRIGSGFRTTVRQGTTRQVLVSVPASDEANLNVAQGSGTLVIEIRNKVSQTAGTVEITMPTLAGADFSGGVTGTVSGFTATTLPITASGGSIITLAGSIQTLSLNLSGGSRFTLSSAAQTLTLEASGGSQFFGYEGPVTNASVNLSGGSQARVQASGTLAVTASGGSQLFYRGAPQLTQNLSGGSTVTRE